MTEIAGRALSPAAHRAVTYEGVTIGYNVLEGVVAVAAGLVAGSVALTGFGVDSGIEVAAAVVVLMRLLAEVRGRGVDERKERLALRFIAATFFALAAYVLVEGARDLVTGAKPDASVVGIALTAASIVVMPWLARAKRRAGEQLGSGLLRRAGLQHRTGGLPMRQEPMRAALLAGHRHPHLAVGVGDEVAADVDGDRVQGAGEPERGPVVGDHR
jgi:hypothetical protein